MRIFGKKEDDFDNKENFNGERKITGGFKNSKSGNKKNGKEQIKPWGKKERIIVLAVLLATTIASALLLFGSYFKLGIKPFGFSLPKIDLKSINPFEGETIIIGGDVAGDKK